MVRRGHTVLCPICDLAAEDAIQCGNCKAWVHRSCASLSPEEYVALTHRSSLEWECRQCVIKLRSEIKHILESVRLIMAALGLSGMSSAATKLESMCDSVAGMSAMFTKLQSEVSESHRVALDKTIIASQCVAALTRARNVIVLGSKSHLVHMVRSGTPTTVRYSIVSSLSCYHTHRGWFAGIGWETGPVTPPDRSWWNYHQCMTGF